MFFLISIPVDHFNGLIVDDCLDLDVLGHMVVVTGSMVV